MIRWYAAGAIGPRAIGATHPRDAPRRARLRRAVIIALAALSVLARAVWATPIEIDPDYPLPPVIEDTARALECTVIYLVVDTATDDRFAIRMRVGAARNDSAADNGFGPVMPCPRDVPVRLSIRALDACKARAADPKTCVFADMAREFVARPAVENTAENMSRCTSDTATHIGLACTGGGAPRVCGAGCGTSAEAAVAAATQRCEARHQQSCPVTGALPARVP